MAIQRQPQDQAQTQIPKGLEKPTLMRSYNEGVHKVRFSSRREVIVYEELPPYTEEPQSGVPDTLVTGKEGIR